MAKKLLTALLACCILAGIPVPARAALDIHAESAIVIDYDTGEVLYEKDADSARVPASMTKILTAYIMYQEMEAGRLQKSDHVKISEHVAEISCDDSYPQAVPLVAGYEYTVDELLNLIMIPSASASCIAIAEHISGSEEAFVARMNQTAKDLGMTATYYNCHGARVNYVTARSLAILVRRFIADYPDILQYTRKSSYDFRGEVYQNTNKLLDSMYYEGADGFKTGTITAAGYCVATTAVRDGRRIISIVMKSSSTNQRFVDSAQLLDFGFAEAARRESARRTTAITLTADADTATPYVPLQITAALSGVSAAYPCRAEWQVNGVPVAGYANPMFLAEDGKQSTLPYIPAASADGAPLTVSLVLSFPDGTSCRGDLTLPVQNTLPVSGSISLPSAQLLAGYELTLESRIAADSAASKIQIPAEWQIDGQAVQGHSTDAFTLRGGEPSASRLTVSFSPEQAGLHEVAFVVNPDGLPGLETQRFTAQIEVLSEMPAAETDALPAA